MADSTFAVLDAAGATVTFRSQDVVGTTKIMMSVPSNLAGTALIGQGVMASSIPVAIASNQSNVPFNMVAFGGTTVSLGQKNSTASVPVAIASDQLSPLGQATSAGSAPVVLPSDQTVSTNLAAVGAVAFSLGQKIMATSIPVAIASNQSAVPISVIGHTAMPASVADGVNIAWFGDKFGRGITMGSVRELRASQYGSTATGAEFTIVNALNATTYADVYGLLLANTGATSTRVDIRYGTGSAVLMAFQVASSDTGGFMVSTGDAFPGSLTTTNVSWTAQCAATTTLSVTALYVKNNS